MLGQSRLQLSRRSWSGITVALTSLLTTATRPQTAAMPRSASGPTAKRTCTDDKTSLRAFRAHQVKPWRMRLLQDDRPLADILAVRLRASRQLRPTHPHRRRKVSRLLHRRRVAAQNHASQDSQNQSSICETEWFSCRGRSAQSANLIALAALHTALQVRPVGSLDEPGCLSPIQPSLDGYADTWSDQITSMELVQASSH